MCCVLHIQQKEKTHDETISTQNVLDAQEQWGKGIVEIGKVYTEGGDFVSVAEDFVDTLYGQFPDVLFKPTKASAVPFRHTKEDALSYMIGNLIEEDTGFAITPWSKVQWENSKIIHLPNISLAMGHYTFTHAQTKKNTVVEYTFGYVPVDGSLKIIVHHSSIPYLPQ